MGITTKQVALTTCFCSGLVVLLTKGDRFLLGLVGAGIEGLRQEKGGCLASVKGRGLLCDF